MSDTQDNSTRTLRGGFATQILEDRKLVDEAIDLGASNSFISSLHRWVYGKPLTDNQRLALLDTIKNQNDQDTSPW